MQRIFAELRAADQQEHQKGYPPGRAFEVSMTLSAARPQSQNSGLETTLREYQTETGRNLLQLLDESPLLLIFLRHFGCSFCRQTLDDVSHIRSAIDAKGIRPVFVHLGSPERAKPYFDYYHLSDVERVSDPEATLHARPVFAIPRKNPFYHFLLPAVWMGWLRTLPKHGIGLIRDDAEQMPAIFYLRQRTIARAYHYKTIADQPDYLKLIA